MTGMGFMGWMPFLSPNQQCHSTDRDTKHSPQPVKITHWHPPLDS